MSGRYVHSLCTGTSKMKQSPPRDELMHSANKTTIHHLLTATSQSRERELDGVRRDSDILHTYVKRRRCSRVLRGTDTYYSSFHQNELCSIIIAAVAAARYRLLKTRRRGYQHRLHRRESEPHACRYAHTKQVLLGVSLYCR